MYGSTDWDSVNDWDMCIGVCGETDDTGEVEVDSEREEASGLSGREGRLDMQGSNDFE
jgi:hypothetical protein